ncbi:MAG TPA: SLC13 family permease [Gammaproteobacteria bacterium]|nr:SLC13 family permease [Gammaproteobacteria bacterium]
MQHKVLTAKNIIAALIFSALAIVAGAVVPSIEIAWVTALLLLTIYLFAFEIVDVDVAAVTIMVLLGLTSLAAPLMGLKQGLVSTQHLFDGFSSNAVISIIAVMIIGAGLDRTGIMSKVAAFILKIGGTTEKRIIPIISTTVAFISSFMQNVGATALFLPVVSRISARSGLPMSRLLMPMGFCAILGGTVTLVGSSPLILLNDLILTSNKALPADQQMATWSLFSVTPVGVALVASGVLYFVLAGRFVLPVSKRDDTGVTATNTMAYFHDVYGIDYDLYEVVVPPESSLVGHMLDDVEHQEKIRVIAALRGSDDLRIGPGGLARDVGIEANSVLGILATREAIEHFVAKYGLQLRDQLETFSEALSSSKAGIAEVVIPPGSQLIGKSARDVWMRKTYGIAMVALHRGGETFREGDGIRDMPLRAGDTLVVHTTWDALARLEKDKNFVVVTTEYPHEELRPHKVGWAAFFFAVALSMVLFTDLRLSAALLTGAIGMVLSGVLTMEEAYEAVSWKTVFLLASLIPLGLAVETSGTAAWIAEQTLILLGDVPTWLLQLAIAALSTFFTLVMSNVGATVLLVPLAVNIAIGAEANPAVFALTVAIATSNSFLIPTHQVNALIMGPGGYRVADFMRAGGIMTVLFLVVMLAVMNLVY